MGTNSAHKTLRSRDQSRQGEQGQAGQGRHEGGGGAQLAAVTPVLRVTKIWAAETRGDGADIIISALKHNSLR